MSRWVLVLGVLLAAACVFHPDLSRFPACDVNGACDAGWTCLPDEGLCLPDCGERGPCPGGSTDGGTELALSSNGPGPGIETVGFTFQFQASGGTPPYAFSNVDALPPGLTLDAQGKLSGAPSQAGNFQFTLDVADLAATPKHAQRAFTLSVLPLLRVAGPTILADFPSGRPYQEQVSAIGGTPPYVFELVLGSALPAGLALHETGQLDGTSSGEGTVFEVRVTDSGTPSQVATRTLQVTLANCSLLCMRTRAVPDGRTGTPYSYALQSSGGTGTLTWKVESGELPPGVQLDASTGVLSGTPTQAGTYDFTVSVADVLDKKTVMLSLKVF